MHVFQVVFKFPERIESFGAIVDLALELDLQVEHNVMCFQVTDLYIAVQTSVLNCVLGFSIGVGNLFDPWYLYWQLLRLYF